ncbi:hypothetical protein GMLC_12890 [Geomonas limicola]|uniref:Uncharacterized protein n=1 Tax=Geomonas limicola TaxID=2740186 RepID=A0A6V8N5N9_9BACT|nr:hypothetical protein [Geomonas limicola]GFO67710.1 hypothetical protein GMLC_12890 [Geomonas limicola]
MQGYELVKAIENEKKTHADRIFIKWWRNEEDFIDFDLVSRFLDNLNYSSQISGFELIDQDEMWKTVERRSNGKAKKVERDGEYKVLWTPPKHGETEITCTECPYTPDTLLKILDAETNDNFID